MVIMRGRFEEYESFVRALRALKDARVRHYEAYGPTNLEAIENQMPTDGSPVRIWNTSGAVIGLVVFWLMCVISALIYAIIVGGKPPVSNVPYVIPAYEGTILVGSILAFAAGLWYAKLGPRDPDPPYEPRFCEDSYGIDVHCEPGERDRMTGILRDAGAVEVNELS